MSKQAVKAQQKRESIEAAIERLMNNKPERVKAGQFSVAAVEKEAGVANGSLKYHLYIDLYEKVQQEIDRRKLAGEAVKREGRGTAKEQRLRAEREKQKRIKDDYRQERDQYKEKSAQNRALVQLLAAEYDGVYHDLKAAKARIKSLEDELERYKTNGGENVVPLR